jgi:hypothetical protein
MNFDMPKAVFCGLALIATAIYFGHGATPSQAASGSGNGRFQCANNNCEMVIDTSTSEVRKRNGVQIGGPFFSLNFK